jgi:hypothetical protein
MSTSTSLDPFTGLSVIFSVTGAGDFYAQLKKVSSALFDGEKRRQVF